MRVEINKSQLLALAGSDKGLLLSIVEDFSENGLQMIGEIERATGEGDAEQFKAHIHQLKGASGSLGLKSLYVLCVSMEKMPEGSISGKCVGELRLQLEVSVQLALSCLRG